ncbi:leucine-rich repeat-containing protein 15-like [Branchiostoma floridae]|uniref:Leucine-rich repeat-containing protein 15-like n=1 Tax=Branchiostoma floridae TaxID=7739 RepID=A0A9J7LWK5_BRAFL|nr:leucine-rich repeat-containing protein 15-like [Branchiostoma floridae]
MFLCVLFLQLRMGYLAILYYTAVLIACTGKISACPAECYCDEPNRRVSCTGDNITEIPKHIPIDTRSLDIRLTSITTIKRGDFLFLLNLRDLSLENNKITSIEEGAFEGLEKMTLLSVNNNRNLSLSRISPNIFRHLPNLTYFYGQNNSLDIISSDLFKKSNHVLQILMDHSGIANLEPRCFANLTRLSMLDLSNNNIKSIGKDVFLGSSKLQSLFLGSNNLVHIDQGAFHTQGLLQFLTLDHNLLESIDGVFEGLGLMVSLTLSNNAIRVIKNGTFKDLRSLHTFDISSNNLEETQSALQDLGDLAQINLSHNRLTKLSLKGMPYLSDVWVNNNRLTEVPSDMNDLKQVYTMDISSNPIQTLAPSPFKDLRSLLKLDISNITALKNRDLDEYLLAGLDNLIELWLERNDLAPIPKTALCTVSQIQILNLNQNGLNSTHKDDLACLRKLTKLQLAKNLLTKIPEYLESLPNLARLDLSENPIVRLPYHSFTNLSSLTNVDLSNSKIELIDGQALYNLNYMETFNIAGNKLTWLPSGIFNATTFSEELDIGRNQWNCDCQMQGFAKDLHSAKLKGLANITCSAPDRYKGHNLLDIPLTNLTCDCDHPRAPSVDMSGSDNQTRYMQPSTLKCSVQSCPDAKVFWSIPMGMILSHDVIEFPGYDVEADGTLVIKSTYLEDAGNYSCTAVNYLGKDTKFHMLKVV